MSELDRLSSRSVSGVPMRPKPRAPEPSPADIIAGAIAGLAGKIAAPAPAAETFTLAQVEQLIASRDQFWADQITKMTETIAAALAATKGRGSLRLVPTYEAGQITSIDVAPKA